MLPWPHMRACACLLEPFNTPQFWMYMYHRAERGVVVLSSDGQNSVFLFLFILHVTVVDSDS